MDLGTKRPNGKTLPVNDTCSPDLLDILLSPSIILKGTKLPNGKIVTSRIKIRGTRDNIKRFWHLIEGT